MNKRIHLANQALRLLPSKTNPRIKRWQAPDEVEAPDDRGKAAYSDPNPHLRIDDLDPENIERMLLAPIEGTIMTPQQVKSHGGYKGVLIGDITDAAHIFDVAKRIAKSSEQVAEFRKTVPNNTLKTLFSTSPAIDMRWEEYRPKPPTLGFVREFRVAPCEWPMGGKMRYPGIIDPAQQAVFEKLGHVPFEGFNRANFAPELAPWNLLGDHVYRLMTNYAKNPLWTEVLYRANPRDLLDGDSFSREAYSDLAKRASTAAIDFYEYPEKLVDQMSKLEIGRVPRIATDKSWRSIMETEIMNPDDITYLEDALKKPIRSYLVDLFGRRLPYRPWKKR